MNEPISRKQRWPLPESAPVIEAARKRRLDWQAAMRAVSNSRLTEHERETRQENSVDNL